MSWTCCGYRLSGVACLPRVTCLASVVSRIWTLPTSQNVSLVNGAEKAVSLASLFDLLDAARSLRCLVAKDLDGLLTLVRDVAQWQCSAAAAMESADVSNVVSSSSDGASSSSSATPAVEGEADALQGSAAVAAQDGMAVDGDSQGTAGAALRFDVALWEALRTEVVRSQCGNGDAPPAVRFEVKPELDATASLNQLLSLAAAGEQVRMDG